MLSEILIAIGSVIGALGGVSSLVSIFYVKQIRQAKELENETKDIDNEARQSEEWRKLYEEERASYLQARQSFDTTIKDKDNKIDELYAEISNQRNQKVDLHNKIAELVVENTKLKFIKCEVPGCGTRNPTTGY